MNEVNLVFIHVGGKAPSYLLDSVRQARRWFDGKIHLGLFQSETSTESLEKSFNVNVVKMDSLDGWLKEAWDLCEPINVFGELFAKATQRLFVLQQLITDLNLERVIHIENDVMIYIDPSKREWPSKGVFLNPLSREFGTWAFTYIATKECLDAVNARHHELLKMGIDALKHRYSGSVNEMLFAGELIESGVVQAFPTLPQDGVDLLFDGSAYGQYAGGTPFHSAGWAERERYVGAALLDKKIDLAWRIDDQNRRYPVCLDLVNNTEARLANLHIHCKRLNEFKS
jgi:hypothetical protein